MTLEISVWRRIILEEKELEKALEEAKRKAEKIIEDARKKAKEIVDPKRIEKAVQEIVEREKSKIDKEAKEKEKMKEKIFEVLMKIDYSDFDDVIKEIIEEVIGIGFN